MMDGCDAQISISCISVLDISYSLSRVHSV